MIGTKMLMELFDDPHRTSLRVHEANAEVAMEIGGVSIPVTGARWKSRQLAGRRQYTLIIQGDADELAYLTQQPRTLRSGRRSPQDEPQDGSDGTGLLPP